MIRHIVLFRFKETAEGRTKAENVAIARQKLEALPPLIPQTRALKVYDNCNFNGTNSDLALISDYDNLDDLEIYRVHPDHVAVGGFMRATTEASARFDFEV